MRCLISKQLLINVQMSEPYIWSTHNENNDVHYLQHYTVQTIRSCLKYGSIPKLVLPKIMLLHFCLNPNYLNNMSRPPQNENFEKSGGYRDAIFNGFMMAVRRRINLVKLNTIQLHKNCQHYHPRCNKSLPPSFKL